MKFLNRRSGVRRATGTPKRRLSIGRRLGLLVVLLGTAAVSVAVIGTVGVTRIDHRIETFYAGTFRHAALTVDLRAALRSTELASLEYALVEDARRRAKLKAELAGTFIPTVSSTLTEAEAQFTESSEHADQLAPLTRMRSNWQDYLQRYGPALFAANRSEEQAAAEKIRTVLNSLIADATLIADHEAAHAAAAIEEMSALADRVRFRLILATLVAGLIGIGIAAWLARSIVRRTHEYSTFAAGIAAGRFGERVDPRGNDELTDLGGLLNLMVEYRDAEQTQAHQHSEFTEAMQLTGSEGEAHNLLKRHLERAIPDSNVTVLSRNNSANRLEPTTAMAAEDPLVALLGQARPRDCLAVRSGQAHRSDGGDALLTCKVCGDATASACRPLLVGGEVIGAVLARRDRSLSDGESEMMRTSVVQAAPLLANLRNLAMAELRAGTDALTGLPNQRASHETMQRAIAQADRAGQPLSVLMLDLDHFKNINDVFGHAEGDNVLAAVGVSLHTTIREGDFCGRFGGEEFIALLPNTDLAGAAVVAEKIRAAIAKIRIPSVHREITASIGAASSPDHGADAATVLRIADRALYAAKKGGRNRVELAPELSPA